VNREIRYKSHARAVADWLQKFPSSLSREQFINAVEFVFDNVLAKTQITVSEVTLSAVLDRVLYNSCIKYPILSELKLEDAKLNFSGFKKNLKSASHSEIKEAFQYFVTEFLFVIGNLTGEVLTTTLYNELSNNLPKKPIPKKRKKDTT
jgi:hypothetical protein